MTKQIRITESTHSKLKIHVVKSKKSIVDFADRAIIDAIKMDKLRAKNLKAMGCHSGVCNYPGDTTTTYKKPENKTP